MGLKVLAPFDGMSCGKLALGKQNIEVDRYCSFEIEKML